MNCSERELQAPGIADLKKQRDSIFSDPKSVYHSAREIWNSIEDNVSKAADVGAGLGYCASRLSEDLNLRVDCVEPYTLHRERAERFWRSCAAGSLDYFASMDDLSPGYDLIISTAVLEHVHNPGNYLSRVNDLLNQGGRLLIGVPNGATIRSVLNQSAVREKDLTKLSEKIIDGYMKHNDHIHSWDALHLTRLLGSCGFRVLKYRPCGGIPLPFLTKIPFLGRVAPAYIYTNIRLLSGFSYGIYFLVEKITESSWNASD